MHELKNGYRYILAHHFLVSTNHPAYLALHDLAFDDGPKFIIVATR